MNDFDLCETFLRQVDGEYHYIVKGKNGEPIPGLLVEFAFMHRYYYQKVRKTLKTDREGAIYLGSLKNIEIVSN
jgi:hypothetical protein